MSECYFCGESEDVALDEHHVVPKGIINYDTEKDWDNVGRTETLCSNCHRKLHTILDPALEFMSRRLRERVQDEDNVTEFTSAADYRS